MDPAIANQDLRPPPEPRLTWAILLAILVNVLLIAAVAWGIQSTRGFRQETKGVTPERTGEAVQPATTAGKTVAQARTECPIRPRLAPAAGGKDGQVFPPADVEGKSGKDIDALLLAGKEAAAAGLVRDAEVDYLTSCRVADALKGPDSIPAADARYQLARHYVNVARAAAQAPAQERAEIFQQAQAYYEDSLERFRSKLGDSHQKARFAAEGLEAAREATAQATLPPGGPEAVATARMGAGPDSSSPTQEGPSASQRKRDAVAARGAGSSKNTRSQVVATVAAPTPPRTDKAKPSFDCRKARSYAERTICSDATLAQLDRDLGRLHARAKQAARDPVAFKRQNDAEWHRREATCRDRGCLLRWYADRRQQLAETLGQAPASADRTASR